MKDRRLLKRAIHLNRQSDRHADKDMYNEYSDARKQKERHTHREKEREGQEQRRTQRQDSRYIMGQREEVNIENYERNIGQQR